MIRHTRCFECVSRKGFILQIPRAPGDGAPSPRFGLSLLGGFELTGPDGVVDLPSKKLADLLAYLACNARRTGRGARGWFPRAGGCQAPRRFEERGSKEVGRPFWVKLGHLGDI